MDAFKLLTKSTKLSSRLNGSTKLVQADNKSNTQISPRKRKRDGSSSEQQTETGLIEIDQNGSKPQVPSKVQSSEGRFSAGITSDWTQDETRSFYKRQNIKITNIRTVHEVDLEAKNTVNKKHLGRVFPQPLVRFAGLESRYRLNSALARNLAAQGFDETTDVQTASLPLLLDDGSVSVDLITIAPTGSGKTLGFLVPLIHKIALDHRSESIKTERHTRAVILSPTKELEDQIVIMGRTLVLGTRVTISAMKKGMRLQSEIPSVPEENPADGDDQEKAEHHETIVKSDIIVSTPLSFLNATGGALLPKVTMLVLDEADILLDPLFREQTLSIWSACNNPNLRVSLWSATIGSNIEAMAFDTIDKHQKRCGVIDPPAVFRIVVGLKDSTLPDIDHKMIYAATESGKLTGIRQLIRPSSSHTPVTTPKHKTNEPQVSPPRAPFLIFTQTIDRATALASEIAHDLPLSDRSASTHSRSKKPALDQYSRIAVLHSSLSPTQRAETMTRFRQGQIWVLIATDLLSRGVDFRGVNTVVNYDIPNTVAAYVHRAGRTGRNIRPGRQISNGGGKESLGGGLKAYDQHCVTFYTKDDLPYLRPIAALIDRASKAAQAARATASNGQNSKSFSAPDKSAAALPSWLLPSLAATSKPNRKALKNHGVVSRLPIRAGLDDEKVKRMKRKARIGTGPRDRRSRLAEQRGRAAGGGRATNGSHGDTGAGGEGGSNAEEEFGGFD